MSVSGQHRNRQVQDTEQLLISLKLRQFGLSKTNLYKGSHQLPSNCLKGYRFACGRYSRSPVYERPPPAVKYVIVIIPLHHCGPAYTFVLASKNTERIPRRTQKIPFVIIFTSSLA